MQNKWITVEGIVKQGHQVASGKGENTPYPQGTIEMQIPFFKKLGLDLSSFFPATLNVSISPYTAKFIQPEYTFSNVNWTALHPPETFSFSRCQILFNKNSYNCFIYYPHPETKRTHFQDDSTLEMVAPFIPSLEYGSTIQVEINPVEIALN